MRQPPMQANLATVLARNRDILPTYPFRGVLKSRP
jgi:hypothetical protein